MKTILLLTAVFALALTGGCSTVDSRIARNRAEYSTWPLPVREKIAAGKIDVGFTPEQVLVALGEPDRKFTRTTSDGTSAVWGYRDHKPKIGFGIGVGVGGFSSRSAVGGGVTLGTGYQDDEIMGIVFDRTGHVSTIETRQK